MDTNGSDGEKEREKGEKERKRVRMNAKERNYVCVMK